MQNAPVHSNVLMAIEALMQKQYLNGLAGLSITNNYLIMVGWYNRKCFYERLYLIFNLQQITSQINEVE